MTKRQRYKLHYRRNRKNDAEIVILQTVHKMKGLSEEKAQVKVLFSE